MNAKHLRIRPVLAALVVAAMAGTTFAGAISGTDYDTIAAGSLVAGPTTTTFQAWDPVTSSFNNMGDLTGRVFNNNGTYTYEMTVTPTVDNISEFNTQFSVLGFNGVAGWSYSDASSAGGTGTSGDVNVTVDPDGTIDYNVNPNSAFFGSGESITFFFQSTLPPTQMLAYGLINHQNGAALNWAPGRGGEGQGIPAPAALPAGMALLGLVGAIRRRWIA